ncbi:hypothetical protein [Nocardiopsis synnemataformans]|uniref:hypothetical protein n=1 Tax=Nocardiopsis synnemataformans TaxID=61305 RepID=UPI003EBD55E9
MTVTQEKRPGALDGFDLTVWAQAIDAVPPLDWQPTLTRLNERFGDRYRIVRLPSCWMITDRDPDTDTEPTIIADTVAEAVTKMLNPGPRFGKGHLGVWPDDRL